MAKPEIQSTIFTSRQSITQLIMLNSTVDGKLLKLVS